MDKRARRQLTKELGLEAGYRVIRFTTGSEFLHYGRFEPDIPRDFMHIRMAQERYLERLIALIPAGVKRILDVGAGSGKTAAVLLDRGYAVDCVSPGKTLAEFVDEHLRGRGTVFRSTYEEAAISGRYDLILFSESFQYIPMKVAIEKSIALLNPGGHILICDYFSREPRPKSPLGGGHRFAQWCDLYPRYPMELIAEQDMTSEAAVVHDLIEKGNREVVLPLVLTGRAAAAARWPFWTRLLLRVFRKRIAALISRQLTEDRSGAEFIRAKFYKIYLFRLNRSLDPDATPG